MNGKQRGPLKRHLKELKKFAPDIYKNFYAHLSLEEVYENIMRNGEILKPYHPGETVTWINENPDGSVAVMGKITVPVPWENN